MEDKKLKKKLAKIPDVDKNGDPIYKIADVEKSGRQSSEKPKGAAEKSSK